MPLTRTLLLYISFIISLISPLAASVPQSTPKLLTPAQWAADLKFLAETLPLRHRHAFDKLKSEEFHKAVADLEARIPALSDQEIIVGLARLVALIRDGHSRLSLPLGSGEAVMPGHLATSPPKEGLYLRVFPVKFIWLSEGCSSRLRPKGGKTLSAHACSASGR